MFNLGVEASNEKGLELLSLTNISRVEQVTGDSPPYVSERRWDNKPLLFMRRDVIWINNIWQEKRVYKSPNCFVFSPQGGLRIVKHNLRSSAIPLGPQEAEFYLAWP